MIGKPFVGRWRRFRWFTMMDTHELPALDGVRGLAIILVIFYHSAALIRWKGPQGSLAVSTFGFSGVLLFFVLSGFLLFLPYARALVVGHPWPSAKRFYRRRVRRILPVYLSVLASMAVLLAGSGNLTATRGVSLGLAALLMHNLSTNATTLIAQINGALWTLAIEWQFYLVLPWIALAFRRWPRPALGALIIGGLALRVLDAAVRAHGIAVSMTAPGPVGVLFRLCYGYYGRYLEVFALGMGLSLLYVVWHPSRRLALWISGLALAAFGGGFPACSVWAMAFLLQPGVPRDWTWFVFGVWITGLCFALLLLVALLPSLRAAFSFAPLRFVGMLSYSIYAWHGLVFLFVRSLLPALAVSMLVSAVSYYGIERPFLRR